MNCSADLEQSLNCHVTREAVGVLIMHLTNFLTDNCIKLESNVFIDLSIVRTECVG